MKLRIIILFLITTVPKIVFGCTCFETFSFNLIAYEKSVNVVELRIVEKLSEDSENSEPKELSDSDTTYLSSPTPPIDWTDFKIEIIETLKGSAGLKIDFLRVQDMNSSCYWEPKIGESYIFYLGVNLNEDGVEFFQLLSICERKIHSDSKNYNSEKDILKKLALKEDGPILAYQNELTENNTNRYLAFQGEFIDKKRNGTWIISEPIAYGHENELTERNLIILKYRNGELLECEYKEPLNRHSGYAFTRFWKVYYEEKTAANNR